MSQRGTVACTINDGRVCGRYPYLERRYDLGVVSLPPIVAVQFSLIISCSSPHGLCS